MPTEYFSSLKKADQKKIESALPKVQTGKALYKRTDKTGVVSFFQLPAKMEMSNDRNFKFEKCKSVDDEKEKLSKMMFEKYTAADKKEAAKEQAPPADKADKPKEDADK